MREECQLIVKYVTFETVDNCCLHSTHPEAALNLGEVQLCSVGPAALQILHQLLDLERWQAEVGLVALKVDLCLVVCAPLG